MTTRVDSHALLGLGIYTIAEAARLAQVAAARIRRWIKGHSYTRRGGRVAQPAVWNSEQGRETAGTCVSFLDLLEVRVVDVLRQRGVPWTTIREVGAKAAERLHTPYPFCTRQFVTLGRKLLLASCSPSGERDLEALLSNQLHFGEIIRPFVDPVDFEESRTLRWWPLGKEAAIVVDPCRSFGAPIVAEKGVPTLVLREAVQAGHLASDVAAWYGVTQRAVRDAVRFEESLAA